MRWLKLGRRIGAGLLIVTGVIGLVGTPGDLVAWGGVIEPVAGHVGWAVMVGVGLLLLVPWEGLQEREQGSAQAVPPPAPTLPKIQPPAEAPALEERTIVDVTPGYLVGLFGQHTSLQGQKLVEPYIGKWMKVSGPLGNVGAFTSFSHVTFASGAFPRMLVFACFRDRAVVENRLSVLRKGDQVTVLGRIDKVAPFDLELEDCELVEPDRSGAS